MAQNTATPGSHRVNIVEYERGWGSKVDERLYFATKVEATDYITTYNKKYNPECIHVPDWYMVAEYGGVV